MRALQHIVGELVGLFVDDWAFALLVLAWVGVVALVLPGLRLSMTLNGPVLFFGLAGLTLVFVARKARR